MAEVEAKKVVLKNLAGEYLVPITEPYIAGDGIKIEDNVISLNEETQSTISSLDNQVGSNSGKMQKVLINEGANGYYLIDDTTGWVILHYTGILLNSGWTYSDTYKETYITTTTYYRYRKEIQLPITFILAEVLRITMNAVGQQPTTTVGVTTNPNHIITSNLGNETQSNVLHLACINTEKNTPTAGIMNVWIEGLIAK